MRLILVRHAQSARNAGWDVGVEDNNLTIRGVHQAIDLAKRLKDEKITAIYCSPSPRCLQTMDEILRMRDDEIQVVLSRLIGPKIKKEDFGKLEKRMIRFMDDLKHDHDQSETILIIGHQLPLGMITYITEGEKKIFGNSEIFEMVL